MRDAVRAQERRRFLHFTAQGSHIFTQTSGWKNSVRSALQFRHYFEIKPFSSSFQKVVYNTK